MVFVPFIYFTLLTAYWWKKHGAFDICVYMSSLYAVSSFFEIVVVYGGMLGEGGILFDETDIELGVLPTILFCLIHTFAMLPFSLIYKKDIKEITPPRTNILTVVGWILIAVSLLNFYLVGSSTVEILSGDLASIRADHYNGIESPAQVKAEALPSFLAYFYYLNTSTLLALPLFFYYLCCDKGKPWWFKALLLFASLSVPLQGIQVVDRTEILLWGMMLVFCLVFFGKFLAKKQKRIMMLSGIPFIVLALIYFIAVTQARFDEMDGGAEAGAVQYAGQGHLNFCFFWENQRTDIVSPEREFPLIYHFLFNIDSNPERRDDRSGQQGFFISVFPTYIGDIMLDITPIGMILWVIYFFLITMLVIKKGHRNEFDIGEMLLIYILSVIPIFGIFYYRYFTFTYTILVMLTFLIYVISKKQLKNIC